MPRKREVSFELKMMIWELAITAQNKPEVICNQLDTKLERLRSEGKLYENTPNTRTIKRIIEKDINLLPKEFVLAKLPSYVWSLRHDYKELKRSARVQKKPLKKLLVLATEWQEQLRCPPPEVVFIDSLGRIGVNSSPMRQDILNIALEDIQFSIKVTHTAGGSNYTNTIDSTFWELHLDGSPKLLCPVERKSTFPELLSTLTDDGKRNFSRWKSLGGRYLEACVRARRVIHDEAKARAGGLVKVDSFFEKIRSNMKLPPGPRFPSHLNVEFGDLIYHLSITCRRSPDVLNAMKGLYHVRQGGPFCDLVFGRHEAPLATGFPAEIERLIYVSQLMVKEFAQSEVIGQLIEIHERLSTLEEILKTELNEIIAEGSFD